MSAPLAHTPALSPIRLIGCGRVGRAAPAAGLDIETLVARTREIAASRHEARA